MITRRLKNFSQDIGRENVLLNEKIRVLFINGGIVENRIFPQKFIKEPFDFRRVVRRNEIKSTAVFNAVCANDVRNNCAGNFFVRALFAPLVNA